MVGTRENPEFLRTKCPLSSSDGAASIKGQQLPHERNGFLGEHGIKRETGWPVNFLCELCIIFIEIDVIFFITPQVFHDHSQNSL